MHIGLYQLTAWRQRQSTIAPTSVTHGRVVSGIVVIIVINVGGHGSSMLVCPRAVMVGRRWLHQQLLESRTNLTVELAHCVLGTLNQVKQDAWRTGLDDKCILPAPTHRLQHSKTNQQQILRTVYITHFNWAKMNWTDEIRWVMWNVL